VTYFWKKNRGLQIPIGISTNNTFYFRSNTLFSQETFSISAIRSSHPFVYSAGYNYHYGFARGGPTGSDHVGLLNLSWFSKRASSVEFSYIFDTFISEQDKSFDASLHNLRLTYNKRWQGKKGSLWYRFSDNDAKLNDQASMTHGIGFSYRWKPLNNIHAAFLYEINSIQFVNVDSAGNKKRENLLQRASLTASYLLQKGVMLSASYTERLNDSNLGTSTGSEVTQEQILS